MSEQAKQQTANATTPDEKIKAVNQILLDAEPGDISTDTYSGNAGYKPQFIVDAMNKVFGIGGWGFDELSTEVVTTTTEKGSSTLAVAKVRVWLKDIVSLPIGWGQARVTKGDLGDAKKGAQTDALKKALSYFSIGNRAYHGLLRAA
jgi:recombination DNA repair RAD52 pathway protein